MDYGRLIGDAWTMTWRYRFLWILALFAPAGVGGCGFNFNVPSNFNPSSPNRSGPGTTNPAPFGAGGPNGAQFERIGPAIAAWVTAHLGLILAIAAVGFILVLVFLFLYFVAQGGLASATIRLARGEPASLGPAWRAGLHFFWRYVGLWLVEILIFIVVVAVIGALVAAVVVLVRQTSGGAAIALGVIFGLLGVALGLAAIVGLILFSVVINYSQRIIVSDDVGPVAAINRGVALTRSQLGSSLLLWLINLGLGIGIGIATVVVDFIILIPLGIVGAIFAIAFHFTAITIAYIVLAVLVFIICAWVVSAIGNTFLWNYWTLGYLRLRVDAPR